MNEYEEMDLPDWPRPKRSPDYVRQEQTARLMQYYPQLYQFLDQLEDMQIYRHIWSCVGIISCEVG